MWVCKKCNGEIVQIDRVTQTSEIDKNGFAKNIIKEKINDSYWKCSKCGDISFIKARDIGRWKDET